MKLKQQRHTCAYTHITHELQLTLNIRVTSTGTKGPLKISFSIVQAMVYTFTVFATAHIPLLAKKTQQKDTRKAHQYVYTQTFCVH